jgi:hypothetical protein
MQNRSVNATSAGFIRRFLAADKSRLGKLMARVPDDTKDLLLLRVGPALVPFALVVGKVV